MTGAVVTARLLAVGALERREVGVGGSVVLTVRGELA